MTYSEMIKPKDAFGWHSIVWRGVTLQCFRTEEECRQWLADTYRIRRALGIVDPPRPPPRWVGL